MSAYSCRVEKSRKSDAIEKADAMTKKSDEIIRWNTLVNSLLSLTASAMAFNSPTTNIAVSW